MKKILLKISYDGSAYAGWQRQKNARTIQEEIENALAKLLNTSTPIFGSSRTDAGVHALAQMATFEHATRIPSDKFSFALNNLLPSDIRIMQSSEVPLQFNPRYMAKQKTYRYYIYHSPHASAIYRNQSLHYSGKLDFLAMQNATSLFVGEHNFTAFESSGGTTISKVRTIYNAKLFKEHDFIVFEVSGNGFLYNMVRIMVGTLLDIGNGKLTEQAILNAYVNKQRETLGMTAKPEGLFLWNILYDSWGTHELSQH